jgi:hypothetical protein
MKNLKQFLLGSFTNDKAGASARKLTAFVLTLCYVGAFCIYCNSLILGLIWATAIFIDVLIVTLCGAAFFLGLISFTQLLLLKNGKTETTHNETTIFSDSSTSTSNELQNDKV